MLTYRESSKRQVSEYYLADLGEKDFVAGGRAVELEIL